jgi:hypothetical protein
MDHWHYSGAIPAGSPSGKREMQLVIGSIETAALDEFVTLFRDPFPRPEPAPGIVAITCPGSFPSCPTMIPNRW